MLGIGDLADRNLPLETCVATLRRALDAGLNVVDTAPGYEDGFSEAIVGVAIAGRRQDLFVISKIDHLDAPVEPQIRESLERMQLEYLDGMVFHGLSDLARYQHMDQPGGAFDQLAACIAAGLVRFGGISSHHPDALAAAIQAGHCDIAMFPVGPFVEPRYLHETLPLARAHGVGTICFKTFGAGKLLGDTAGYNQPLQLRPRGKISSGGSNEATAILPRLSVAECLHYTLSYNPDVALLGLSFPNEQDQAFAAAESFIPLDPSELESIRQRAIIARQEKGPCWWNPDPQA
jgi:aryl-alcohol dehydrogenase-like predicted oxidoreductase